MTCHEARELFSGAIDDALEAQEQAALDAHLVGCADCRRELDRFRRTVAFVQALPPERAPIGFVDRVVAAVQPEPWYVRLARGLFVPWTTKLPQEAAAIILIAGLAVWVFQRTPEQQQSTRLEQAPPRVEAPAPAEPGAPLPDAQTPATTPPGPTAPMPTASAPTVSAPTASAPTAPAPTVSAPTASAPTPAPSAAPEKQEAGEARSRNVQALRLQKPSEEAPREPYAARDAPDKRQSTTSQRMITPEPAADVLGLLVSNDPAVGATRLGELASRLGGSVTTRSDVAGSSSSAPAARSDASAPPSNVAASRQANDGRLVELTVPRDRYADFIREVARLGRWQAESEAAPLPESVRLRIRVTR
ncbi:MAG: hypothetical protein E6G14_16435 [Actinobacteria bacterium]|nr:MAG: hypothetical protein E6G14_16435 [Actinomycetota bacterium]